jgi:hypothetical protein
MVLFEPKTLGFLPAKAGEITQTDLNIDIKAPLKKGLSGIEAQFIQIIPCIKFHRLT